VVDEAVEEVGHQFGLEIADVDDFDQIFVDEGGAAAEIDGDDGERFIHREDEVAGAVDPFAIAEGFREELADDDTDVFDGVVLIHIEITFGGEFEVEAAVFGEELEHVVEEADTGCNVIPAAAFDAELAFDLRLLGIALDFCGSRQVQTPES